MPKGKAFPENSGIHSVCRKAKMTTRTRNSEKTVPPNKLCTEFTPATSKVVKVKKNDGTIQDMSLPRAMRRKYLRAGG